MTKGTNILTETLPGSRLDRLLSLLDQDPDNLPLLTDTAEAAVAQQDPVRALELLDRRLSLAEPTERERNLAGLANLQNGNHAAAADIFGALVEEGASDPGLRFNLAWALAHIGEKDRALFFLKGQPSETLAQAAMLEMQLLHERGAIDEALVQGKRLVDRHSGHAGFCAALAVAAVDGEESELAERAALLAGDHPDALCVLGSLALERGNRTRALANFDRAIDLSDATPRAWLGRGMTKLVDGKAEQACEDLDQAAARFKDHGDSWNAAGWAWLMASRPDEAEARFEKASTLDPSDADALGGMAMSAALANEADRATAIAGRALAIDPDCLPATLAINIAKGNIDPTKVGDDIARAFSRSIGDGPESLGAIVGRMLRGQGEGGFRS